MDHYKCENVFEPSALVAQVSYDDGDDSTMLVGSLAVEAHIT